MHDEPLFPRNKGFWSCWAIAQCAVWSFRVGTAPAIDKAQAQPGAAPNSSGVKCPPRRDFPAMSVGMTGQNPSLDLISRLWSRVASPWITKLSLPMTIRSRGREARAATLSALDCNGDAVEPNPSLSEVYCCSVTADRQVCWRPRISVGLAITSSSTTRHSWGFIVIFLFGNVHT